LHGIVGAPEETLRFIQEDPAGMGQLDMPFAACEQRDPQLLLEQPHLVTQCWLGDVHALGCPREMELLGDGNEVTQLAKVHLL